MLQEPDKFARLILLRHPEILDPERSQALGQRDASLSRRGKQQCVEVLRSLADVGVHRVVTSPTAHCVDAATAIAADRGLEHEVVEAFRGQRLGGWEGRLWSELHAEQAALVREFFRDYGKFAPPEGGETLSDAVDRVLGWWSEGVDELENQTVLVVAAAPLLGAFAARLLGLGLGRAPALNLPAAGFGILDVFRDGAALRAWHPNALRDDMP